MMNNKQSSAPRQPANSNNSNPLSIIFDIDGTLIRESRHIIGIKIRPYTVDFLVWCLQRGHHVAVWTAGDVWWADRVVRKICPLVQEAMYNHQEEQHVCTGKYCRATFEFAWGGDKMRREPPLKNRALEARLQRIRSGTLDKAQCHWCEFYSNSCDKCACHRDTNDCQCQNVKDLRKIWYNREKETTNFRRRERTLVVENTPQMCRYNYGNAIYVPTYRGGVNDFVFEALQLFIELELEKPEVDVRKMVKCDHPAGPHACFSQKWWPTPS